MLGKLWASTRSFVTPTEIWTCTYWRMDNPERVTETFSTQIMARDCSLRRGTEGYLAIVRYGGKTSNHEALLGAIKAVAGVVSNIIGSSSNSSNHSSKKSG